MDAMTKKCELLISALLLAVVVALGVLAMLPSRPGVTKGNFDRIEKGMTKAEVEEIFGKKDDWAASRIENPKRWWSGNNCYATVSFVDNCVAEKQWTGIDETLLVKIRHWLHLP
jgi:hypothetical protein